jgi:hypothetical protein
MAQRRLSADKFSKPQEPAMQIGEQREEFEILLTEEGQEPLLPPEPEPQRQPEDTPA